MTDFVSVKSGDGQLHDFAPGEQQLHDDFRIEMKAVGVQIQRQGIQRGYAVHTVACVKFRQT